jgi:hypothetical protein
LFCPSSPWFCDFSTPLCPRLLPQTRESPCTL